MFLPALRPAWWIVLCGLISTLSLSLALPALGFSAAGYSPFHQHVITGADDPAERRQALAEHTHAGGPTSAHPSPAGSVARALSVSDWLPVVAGTAPDNNYSSYCPACAPHLLADIDRPTTSAPPSLWQQMTSATLFGAWFSAPPPALPPR